MKSAILSLSESFAAGDENVLSMFDEALSSVKKERSRAEESENGVTYSELLCTYHVVYTLFKTKAKQKGGSDEDHAQLLINGVFQPFTGERIEDSNLLKDIAKEISIKHNYDTFKESDHEE